MKRMTLSALLLTAALGGNVAMAQESEKPYVSDVWVADLGNGKYHNPKIDQQTAQKEHNSCNGQKQDHLFLFLFFPLRSALL